MTGVLLLLALVAQDTTLTISPRARAMLGEFPPPRHGEVSVATRFSSETAWVGEQVELVTAAWFPQDLRAQLRRSPTLGAPSLSGLWSVQSQGLPILAERRAVNGHIYDLYIQHQTLFPLGAGRIEAPPAVLTYSVPTSASFFAPEERKTVASRTAVLTVRGIPPALAATLGSGPTARNLRVTWIGPANALQVGTPATVDLVISGQGNLALWPTPSIEWPAGLRVYPERATERDRSVGGLLGGEKRFRFTLVADSPGVYTLPRVRYPYFDPANVDVVASAATPLTLAVVPARMHNDLRTPPPVTGEDGVPLASAVVHRGAIGLALLALLPLMLFTWRRRRRQLTVRPATVDPEAELRRLLGTPADAGPDGVTSALRHRGIAREDAEQLQRWLSATSRRRYGPAGGAAPPPPDLFGRILERLRGTAGVGLLLLVGATRLSSQAADGAARYRAGDYAGAATRFEAAVRANPRAEDAWRDLGSSRWMLGDDVGAAAAWLEAMELAPRDPFLQDAWRHATSIPAEVRATAPSLPLSRDELLLLALAAWLGYWGLRRTSWRRVRGAVAAAALLALVLATVRTVRTGPREGLVRVDAMYHVSPIAVTPTLGQATAWSRVRILEERSGWILAELPDGHRGWLPGSTVARLGSLD